MPIASTLRVHATTAVRAARPAMQWLRTRAAAPASKPCYPGDIPPEVAKALSRGVSAARAWRLHRGIGVDDMAARLAVTPARLMIVEASAHLRSETCQRFAVALAISPALLATCHRQMARPSLGYESGRHGAA